MATWRRLERLNTQGEQSVIPCRKSVKFRYFDFEEAKEVTAANEKGERTSLPCETSPLPSGFWGNLAEVPSQRGSVKDLPIIPKPQRPRMGTTDYKRRNSASVFTRNSFRSGKVI
ncbi:unnamed protein product [Cylicostephanus goldi]|uniref:Uncharacterized protein n=1 Tax=Cylicostephanus goldi TaxID=71465 RepID=A0A3P6R8L0_CYLGO|nr:unnamed protein product [Cylicostephanus goldi]